DGTRLHADGRLLPGQHLPRLPRERLPDVQDRKTELRGRGGTAEAVFPPVTEGRMRMFGRRSAKETNQRKRSCPPQSQDAAGLEEVRFPDPLHTPPTPRKRSPLAESS